MTTSRHQILLGRKIRADESGQAMVEFAVIATMILLLLFGVIDFGRALSYLQVMTGLTRQGSNLASRGDTLSESAAAVVSGAAPLDLSHNGEVIVTSVTNVAKVNLITGQVSQGGISRTSKIGSGVGTPAKIPAAATAMILPGQTIYVTEVFYSYQPVTPIGNMLNVVLPSTLYEAAYF